MEKDVELLVEFGNGEEKLLKVRKYLIVHMMIMKFSKE